MMMMKPKGGDRVYKKDFRNFVRESLLACFDKISNRASSLNAEDMRPISKVMSVPIRELMRDFPDGVDRGDFIWFIMDVAMSGLKRGGVVEGLGKILVMGGSGLQVTMIDYVPEWEQLADRHHVEKVLTRLFIKLDDDGSGYVDSRELEELGRGLSDNWSERQTEALLKLIDKDGDRKLYPLEFRAFIVKMLLVAFDRLDHDHSGYLDSKELWPLARCFQVENEILVKQFREYGESDRDIRVKKTDFVKFIITQVLANVNDSKRAKAGLGKILILGGDENFGSGNVEPHVRKLFTILDRNSDNYLDSREFRSLSDALKDLKDNERKEYKDVLSILEGDNKGRLHYPEFRDAIVMIAQKQFDRLDTDKAKRLTEKQMEPVAAVFGISFKEVMEEIGTRDREVGRTTFIAWVIAYCVVLLKRDGDQWKRKLTKLFSLKVEGGSFNLRKAEDAREVEARIRILFDALDADKNGYLDKYELKELGKTLKSKWSERETDTLMSIMDLEGDGRIEPDEFAAFLKKMLLTAFDRLDKEQKGSLASRDLEQISESLNVDHQGMMKWFGGASIKVSRVEFVDYVVSLCLWALKGRKILDGFAKIVLLGGEGGSAGNPETRIFELFQMIDKDKNGYLDKYELSELGDALKKEWKKEDNETLIKMLDKDGNGRVYPPEFRDFIMTMLLKSFSRLDLDKNGTLSDKELMLVSKAFERDHRDIKAAFGNKSEITRSLFVDFVVSYCIQGIRAGQVLRGLGKMILLGGGPGGAPKENTTRGSAYAVDSDGEWAGVRLTPLAQDSAFKLFRRCDNTNDGKIGLAEVRDLRATLRSRLGRVQNSWVMKFLDTRHNSGRYGLEDFTALVVAILLEIYERHDRQKRGVLGAQQLTSLFKAMTSPSGVKELQRKLDTDYGNQLIPNPDFVEFFLVNVIDPMSFQSFKNAIDRALSITVGGAPRSPAYLSKTQKPDKTVHALKQQLSRSQHANQKLARSLEGQHAKDAKLRVKDGGLLGTGFDKQELEEIERQMREQEALLQGYKQENELIGRKLKETENHAMYAGTGYGEDYDQEHMGYIADPITLPIGGGVGNQLAHEPETANVWSDDREIPGGPRELKNGENAYLGDAVSMLAQIAQRIAHLELPIKEIYQSWADESREILSVEQFMQGLRNIGLHCPIELCATMVNAFDSHGEGFLRFGDFNKIICQGHLARECLKRGSTDIKKLSHNAQKFHEAVRSMRLADTRGAKTGGYMGTHQTAQPPMMPYQQSAYGTGRNTPGQTQGNTVGWGEETTIRDDPFGLEAEETRYKTGDMSRQAYQETGRSVEEAEFVAAWPGTRQEAIRKFRNLDVEANGFISEAVFAQSMGGMGVDLSKTQRQRSRRGGGSDVNVTGNVSRISNEIFNEVDRDGDSRISEEEFIRAWPGTQDEALRKFDEVDRNRSGFISRSELSEAIQRYRSGTVNRRPATASRRRGSADSETSNTESRERRKVGVAVTTGTERSTTGRKTKEAAARSKFKSMDKNRDGVVDKKEFISEATKGKTGAGKKAAAKEAEAVFRRADKNGDGVLTEQEVVQAANHGVVQVQHHGAVPAEGVDGSYGMLIAQLNQQVAQRDAEISLHRSMQAQYLAMGQLGMGSMQQKQQPPPQTWANPPAQQYQQPYQQQPYPQQPQYQQQPQHQQPHPYQPSEQQQAYNDSEMSQLRSSLREAGDAILEMRDSLSSLKTAGPQSIGHQVGTWDRDEGYYGNQSASESLQGHGAQNSRDQMLRSYRDELTGLMQEANNWVAGGQSTYGGQAGVPSQASYNPNMYQ